jgi:hypothetical protein
LTDPELGPDFSPECHTHDATRRLLDLGRVEDDSANYDDVAFPIDKEHEVISISISILLC